MSLPVSLQLYSVRDSMTADFEGTLRRVHELGYSAVEFAGFYDRTPDQINELLARYSLTVSGTHSSFDDLLNRYEETVAFHQAIGNKNYIIPWFDLSDQSKLDGFIEKVNPIARRLAGDGIALGFHNHSGEFKMNRDGSVAYEQLIYRTELMLEVDTYWAFVGMREPLALLERLGSRVKFIHIKDGSADGQGMPLGRGEAPVSEVYKKAVAAGIPLVVESETCKPDGLTEAQICMDYLRSLEK